MSHMVIYRGADGKPGYHQTDDIHDAVGFVEQMRNDEGVEHARIFRLEEVVFEYRPYYRVELSAAGTPMMIGAPAAPQLADLDSPSPAAIPSGSNGVEHDSVASANGVSNGALNGAANGSAHQDTTTTGPVNGNGAPPDQIDLVDEVIDVVDAPEEPQPKADAGSGKKGLFGR